MQAQDNFAIYNTYYQIIWRGGQQWQRTVPIVNNVVRWDLRGDWRESTLDDNPPGSSAVTAQGNYVIDWRADINPDYRRGEIRVERGDFGPNNRWFGYTFMYFVSAGGATTPCYTYPHLVQFVGCDTRRVDSALIKINTNSGLGSPPHDDYLARHEMGHVFGRGHPACNSNASVMYEPGCGDIRTSLTSYDTGWINANY